MTDRPDLARTAPPNFLRRVGGMLVHPRALLANLSAGTGKHDATLLLIAWLLAVAVTDLGAALADLWALGGLEGLLALAQCVWPVLPWLITSALVERLLGPERAHRAALCLVPMLVIGASGHLLTTLDLLNILNILDILTLRSWYAPALGGLTSSIFAIVLRPAIAPLPAGDNNLSAGTGPQNHRLLTSLLGLAVIALTTASAGRDLAGLIRVWPTLAPTSVGDPLPAFTVPLLDGGTLSSGDLQSSQPHLLIFWTTWCGVCEAEMPMYSALADRHPNLQIIAINADRDSDAPALVRAYRDAHALRFPIALDPAAAMVRGFRVRMYPHIILIDAHGQIRGVFRGRTSARTLDAAIADLTP